MGLITIDTGENFLRQISQPVDIKNDKELSQNIEILKEFTLSHAVFAMAAVQLGIPKRLLYLKSFNPNDSCNTKNVKVMINPEILSQKGRTEYWEACASCLDNFALVERPYELVIKYQTLNGEEEIEKFEGFSSTVISHELDHLDGILHMDRAKNLLQMSADERKLFRESHPYKIFSKDCNFCYNKLSRN